MSNDEQEFLKLHAKEVSETPVSRGDFRDLMDIAAEAMRGERRAFPPDIERFTEDNPPRGNVLTDCPDNQMSLLLVQECRRRYGKERGEQIFISTMARRTALTRAVDNGRCGKHFHPLGDGTVKIHTAILDAAAECPITSAGEFDQSYEQRVAEIVTAEESHS